MSRPAAIPRPPRYLRRGRRQVVASFVTAVLLAVTVALTTLLVADLLPAAGRGRLPLDRSAALVAAWVGLLLAIRWQVALRRPARMLVHVRLVDESIPQDESMRERHLGLLRQARRRDLLLKSVTRWVSLTPGEDEPADLVTACAHAAAEVEAMINSDSEGSRLVLAADMPWPAALGVGAQLPVTADCRLMELTGRPLGTGRSAPEALFSLPWKPPRSLGPLAVEHSTLPDHSADGRVGLLLALTLPLRQLDPTQVFAGLGVSEYHVVQPSWVAVGGEDVESHRFTGKELASLARRLPPAIASVKRRCGDRELVVAGAMPAALAMAVGWGLAQNVPPFFTGTQLLHHDVRSSRYRTVRVHPSQRGAPDD